MKILNINAEFISDICQRTTRHPYNLIGCTVVADLSVALMFPVKQLGQVTVWPLSSTDPRNTIGLDVIDDERRTKQLQRCRVGTSTQFLKMLILP